jgi:hypothetical protein
VLAPGVRIVSGLPPNSALAQSSAEGQVARLAALDLAGARSIVGMFQQSGTSMAAAEVSGLAALLLSSDLIYQRQVKWLLARAHAWRSIPKPARRRTQPGSRALARSTPPRCWHTAADRAANLQMDIARDLDISANGEHYVGATSWTRLLACTYSGGRRLHRHVLRLVRPVCTLAR